MNSTGIELLPERQVRPLLNAYGRAVRASRWNFLATMAVVAACILIAGWMAEVKPGTFVAKIGGFGSYFNRLAHLENGALVLSDPQEWFWGLRKWLRLMGETMLIAYTGTFVSAAFAIILSFWGSPNLSGSWILRSLVKRLLEFCRTVPELVFALIFVVAFGLGPFPGILAITIHTIGALGKQFSELVENIDNGPLEGLAASGANKIAIARFGILPQVAPGLLSYTLLRFESNVRTATTMGLVGAGGIGDELMISIRQFHYADVSAILTIILITVIATDLITGRLRNRILSGRFAA